MASETTLKIPAIDCQKCVDTISRALGALPSVEVAQADTDTKLVRFEFDEAKTSERQIREALDEIGFSADE